jgi:hypothetical protein
MQAKDYAEYVVRLRPLPSNIAPAIRLRQVLKFALRACRLRCLAVQELPAGTEATGTAPDAAPHGLGEV